MLSQLLQLKMSAQSLLAPSQRAADVLSAQYAPWVPAWLWSRLKYTLLAVVGENSGMMDLEALDLKTKLLDVDKRSVYSKSSIDLYNILP